jgi:FkbH-like protein
VLGDRYLAPYSTPEGERAAWPKTKLAELQSLVSAFSQRSQATVLLHNFDVPLHSPLGILENRQKAGMKESVEQLNALLRDAFRDNPAVFVFDYDAFCSRIGKQRIRDPKMYYLGDLKLDPQLFPELCARYADYVRALRGLTRKCLVLDLDNTLWGGILGEDGFDGIALGPTPQGRPFMEFQQAILALYQRGVILAINSKNNQDEVLRVLREHPSMVLKESHFAAMRINWNDKVSNMQSIAKELNIGLDSLVFLDDDKANRAVMRSALPEVQTVEMPEDPSRYLQTLHTLDAFHALQLTEEDLKKGQMFAEQRKRQEFQENAKDINEYLAQLQTKVTLEPAASFTIPRITQLTQKTNQFTMTTKRYSEEDIRRFAASRSHVVFSAKVEDKFGDSGTTGAVIIEKKPGAWLIDTFLLSCRVIGRGVEEALLAHIAANARKEGANKLIGIFIPTSKNAPAKEFYSKSGFILAAKEGTVERWEYDLAKPYPFPQHIALAGGHQ